MINAHLLTTFVDRYKHYNNQNFVLHITNYTATTTLLSTTINSEKLSSNQSGFVLYKVVAYQTENQLHPALVLLLLIGKNLSTTNLFSGTFLQPK